MHLGSGDTAAARVASERALEVSRRARSKWTEAVATDLLADRRTVAEGAHTAPVLAKAARAAGQNESVPLEKVVIATGTVDGRVTRVEGNMVQLRDGEGNVYQLRIDKRSRGVRQLRH